MMTDFPSDITLKDWGAIEERQLKWAFHAYERLLETLSEDVQKKFGLLEEEQREAYIVVFGKTQVGKTTLLLELMGIEGEQLSKISKLLRGGRANGQSATATVMEYCRSMDNRWGLAISSSMKWFSEDEEMERRLRDLRSRMEAGNLTSDSPCVVHIPQHFFAPMQEGAKQWPHVRMLDLPGDNPANFAEQEHVEKMARKYLPFADLILLVGRADDLGFLQPNAIILPKIEDWQSMSSRFRVVITYAYSSQSIRDLLGDPSLDAAQLRQHFIGQIETFSSLSNDARSGELYFPLEFGDSWRGVEENNPALYERMKPIIAQLREELLQTIADATSPLGRLRGALNMHASIRYIQSKKTEHLEQELKKINEEHEEQQDSLCHWIKIITRYQEKINKGLALAPGSVSFNGIALTFQKAANREEKKEPTLKEMLLNCKDSLMSAFTIKSEERLSGSKNNFNKMAYRNYSRPNPQEIREILDKFFSAIDDKLTGRWFNGRIAYWVSSANYKADYDELEEAYDKAAQQLRDVYIGAWEKACDVTQDEIRQSIRQLEGEYFLYRNEYQMTLNRIETLEKEKTNLESELARSQCQLNEDLKRCDQFGYLLDEEYLEALNGMMNEAAQETDDYSALLKILACESMKNLHADFAAILNKER